MRGGVLAALLLSGILAACGSSPPSRYYVLSAQPDPAAVRQIGGSGRTLALGAVKLPGALDRPQIARQLGPNQLEYAETDRWAGPLDDMTRRVLAADLRPLLPAGTTLVSGRFVERGRADGRGRSDAVRRRQDRTGEARRKLADAR